ncbi:unnamed protein product [Phytophthora fragariaefolia]|uniref:Serine/threonine-protein phosphatase n=2 Tax=Eukaryota TaxID=2759 RepID=A0A9W7CYT1_9STRA|nr:unnamed protein product [Phytophthora fragariaefolia]
MASSGLEPIDVDSIIEKLLSVRGARPGKQSLETICLLLAYKIKYPENFFILRGNHECASINRIYGFYDECKRRYNIKLWKTFTDCFNCLPVAAIVDEKIFCMHGGLSPELSQMEQIKRFVRPTDVPDTGLLCDLLWSDPDKDIMGWGENDRGVSFTFGPDIVSQFLKRHDLDLICRAHQVVEDGYEFFAKRQLVTLFSAPNYCGEFDNAGAMMSVDETLMCSFQILKPAEKKQRYAYNGLGTQRPATPPRKFSVPLSDQALVTKEIVRRRYCNDCAAGRKQQPKQFAPSASVAAPGSKLPATPRQSNAAEDEGSGSSSGRSLGLRRSSSTSVDSADTPPGPVTLGGSRPTAAFSPPLYHHRRQHDVAVSGSMPLDTVSKGAPPHVAVRYGDTIRLFARSKYAGAAATGGHVGTFEGGKRFLASKSAQKQDELACIPPIAACGAKQYKPSSFVILSNCGLGVGTPVSYGDVVVLVDADGRVWNNKMGVGPSTKNGCFGPKESNTPGEMYLSFYQLQPDTNGDDSSSDSSDDEDNFLFFSNLAKTTKTMAETTFGKPTQVELHLATAALRTMGKVMYYGDKNLIIDVADSNRTRSKFNRVITHFSKQQEAAPVQGGYLRCDGRGKTILFELHGLELPTILSIDVKDVKKNDAGHDIVDADGKSTDKAGKRSTTAHVLVSSRKDVEVGSSITLQDLRRSMMLVLHFSDGGRLRIPCQRFLKHEGRAFYRVVLNGKRPLRVLVRATRAVGRKKGDLRGTLRGTYRQIFKLSIGIVFAYLSAASVFTHVFGSIVVLPAVYVGLAAAVLVFSAEVFFPGKMVTARQIKPVNEHELGNWTFTVVALEASESERLEITSNKVLQEAASIKVPPAFIVAENGDVSKATERYQITLAWRKEMLADSILSMPQTHYETIKANYTQFLHKHDKLGHPLYFEKIGSINIPQLKKVGVTQDALFKHYLFAMEFSLKYAAHQTCPCDACASSETQKMCIVLDARGIGMRDMGGEAFEFIRRCTGAMQRHYPQRSFKIFIVNVPSWFGMAWKGVKPLLNEATRAKTNILTESETASALLEFIDADNLPVEYGGTCSCAGGCETNSTYQRLQRVLVQSVLECKPFEAENLIQAIAQERSGEGRSSSEGDASAAAMPACSPPPPVMGPIKRETSATAVLDQLFRIGSSSTDDGFTLDGVDDEGFCRSIPAGFFSEEVLKAGYLLKRSLRHKQFNPIWHRQLFILHPQFVRFAKTLDSEIYQIVSLTHDTVVQKTAKQNNSFELITPLMAANGHSLLLYAPTPAVLNTWVDAIQAAIEQMKLRSPTPAASPERSPIASPRAQQEASPEPDDQPRTKLRDDVRRDYNASSD